MSELQLAPQMPLRAELLPRRIGRPDRPAGVAVHARTNLSLALIMPRRGRQVACADNLQTSYDLQAPAAARIVHGRTLSIAWAGPDAWLAIANTPNLEKELRTIVANNASIVDTSDQRIVIRISGPKTRTVLAKGVAIDLHPRMFAPGDTAITSLAHVTIQLWQVDERPTFDLVMPRASAHDVFHWLTVSAAEFGLDIVSEQV